MEKLNHILDSISNRKKILFAGDFNAHVGSQTDDATVGPNGKNDINDNGLRFVELCHQHLLPIQNGFFKHKNIYKYSHPTLQRKAFIVLILTRQTSKIKLLYIRV